MLENYIPQSLKKALFVTEEKKVETPTTPQVSLSKQVAISPVLTEFLNILTSLETVIPDETVRFQSAVTVMGTKGLKVEDILKELDNLLAQKQKEYDLSFNGLKTKHDQDTQLLVTRQQAIAVEVGNLTRQLEEKKKEETMLGQQCLDITHTFETARDELTANHEQDISELSKCREKINTLTGSK